MAEQKVRVPTQDELKGLSPEERIRRLKEIEELRRKELEEARKQAENEIAEAEDLIKETEEELEEETDEEDKKGKKRHEDERHREEEESLEERLAKEKSTKEQQEQAARPQYNQPTTLYNTLEQAAERLESLYGNPNWNEREQQVYRETKEQIERAQSYSLTSERLEEELGLASGMLNRLKYRR